MLPALILFAATYVLMLVFSKYRPCIALGSALDMSFMDFFFYKGKPSMFFAVELGAVLSALILYWIFRKEKGRIEKNNQRTKVTDYVPTILLGGAIVLLILASFLPEKPAITNGLICCGLLVAGLIFNYGKKKNFSAIVEPLKGIDFETIGTLRKAGYEVKNGDFFKIGIPFTLAAIIPAYIYIWMLYGIH